MSINTDYLFIFDLFDWKTGIQEGDEVARGIKPLDGNIEPFLASIGR